MSEDVVIGTGTEKIHGTYVAAVAHIEPALGARYDAWLAKDPTTRKKALVSAVRYFNAQKWVEDANTFVKREALLDADGKPVFHIAQYELAVLLNEDPTITDAANQGSNLKAAYSQGDGVEYFAPTMRNATKLPALLMRLVGGYLAAPTASSSIGSVGGQAGSGSNPFSECGDFERKEPW